MWLKQSTLVTIRFGPFLDFTDGVTPETGLATAMDNATTGIRVSKNGGNMIDRNDATAPVHDEIGYYDVDLSTTDTNTLGTLRIMFSGPTVNTPAWQDFMVVPANVWDSLFGADLLDVNTAQWLGNAVTFGTGGPDVNINAVSDDTTAAANLELACDNYSATRGLSGTALPAVAAGSAGGVPVIGTTANTFKSDSSANVTFANTSIATVTTATNVTTVNGLAAGVITAAAIADAAIDNATFAADVGTTAYATNNIALAANKALDDAMVETTGAPAITGTFRAALEWMFALSRNKITQTATTTTLRNDADSGDLATSTVSDDATTYTRGEWSV